MGLILIDIMHIIEIRKKKFTMKKTIVRSPRKCSYIVHTTRAEKWGFGWLHDFSLCATTF